jgi:hypothetical protein
MNRCLDSWNPDPNVSDVGGGAAAAFAAIINNLL